MDVSARNDAIAGLMVLGVVAVFGPVTSDIFIDPRDPGFSAQDFPIGVLTLIAILGVGLLASSVVKLAKSGWKLYEPGEAEPVLRFLVPIGLLGFFYVWLIEQFQYPLPTFFVLSASLAIFGNRGAMRLIVVPAIVTAVFYLLFYGVFGLNEAPGEIISYDNQWYFRPLRESLGLM
jgi:hypothetical protein